MANPSVSFTDGTGAVTITSPCPRLGNWIADAVIIGEEATPLGTGIVENFVHRIDYVAAFEMQEIPLAASGVAVDPYFQRLKLFLAGGGTFTVTTADLGGNVYTCTQQEKKPPTWTLDRVNYCYTLKVYARNGTQAPMVVAYQPADA